MLCFLWVCPRGPHGHPTQESRGLLQHRTIWFTLITFDFSISYIPDSALRSYLDFDANYDSENANDYCNSQCNPQFPFCLLSDLIELHFVSSSVSRERMSWPWCTLPPNCCTDCKVSPWTQCLWWGRFWDSHYPYPRSAHPQWGVVPPSLLNEDTEASAHQCNFIQSQLLQNPFLRTQCM